MKTSDFDYELPPELIAQTPIEPRDSSRLMVVERGGGSITHYQFSEITDYLREGDVLVFNDSRVIPARLSGLREGGGKAEILLLRPLEPNTWEALVKPGKRLPVGGRVYLGGDSKVTAEVVEIRGDGVRVVRFSDDSVLPQLGKVPLPPYIHAPLTNAGRYQTVYARINGSAAAPTAGLHFTPELLEKIQASGAQCLFVTLHIGLDTFRPVKEADPLTHAIHKEYGMVSGEAAATLSRAKKEGRRIICVGTTAARLVEHASRVSGPSMKPFEGWVDLFILPGHRFQSIDALLTNFHLPKSTLIMLVSAFAGKELIETAYREAIAARYRFYSFGDAMLIL